MDRAGQEHSSFGDVWHGGGTPGAADPAFTARIPEQCRIPVVISAPHGGRAYPRSVLERMRHPALAALKLEDRLIDQLALDVARRAGAAVLVAHAPRAMIDLNRATDDVDWDMISGTKPAVRPSSFAQGLRARTGLGLIPRRLPGFGEIWKRKHERSELEARIEGIHVPYHVCLAQMLERLRERWGAVLLIDLHSMPPLAPPGTSGVARIVVGDRFGASADGVIVAECFAELARARWPAAHNRPYAGGYVLQRHARPGEGIHAVQLEVDRSSYLDPHLNRLGPGFLATSIVLAGVVERLGQSIARIEPMAEAAE